MQNKKTYEIIAIGEISLKHVPSKSEYSDSIKEKIQQIWKNEFTNSKKELFNDKVLSFVDISHEGDEILVRGKYVDYKTILADRIDPNLGLDIYQIGVSGLIVFNDMETKYILFSTRDSGITEYPGYLELVPSGNIDKQVLRENGIIDYKSKICQEFTEETGLSSNCIKSLKSFCFVKDLQNRVYDVCCLIEINEKINSIKESFNKVSEYHKPEFVIISELPDFIKKNTDRIVPTSLAILECFIGQTH